MKGLIIGATGLLGKLISEHLESKGYQIIKTPSEKYNARLGDGKAIEEIIKDNQPEFIINSAAITNVDLCESSPQKAFLVNAVGCEEISEAINKFTPMTRLIHISTDHFYDSPSLSKEDEITLLNYYAYSKFLGERMITCKNHIILRTNFFGKGKSKKNSFTDWLYYSAKNGTIISLYKNIYFNPLSINTLINLIENMIDSKEIGTFNVGSRGVMSKFEFGVKFFNNLGFDKYIVKESNYEDSDIRRPKNMAMDVTKFETSFGLTLPSLEDEIYNSIINYTEGN